MKSPLSVTHPELAAQWHPTKNGDLAPDRVAAGTHVKVWWRCPKDGEHMWQATVVSRTRLGTGCPFCSGRRATATTSLRALRPDLAAQWHPTKNGDLTPDDLKPGSGVKVWWLCAKDPAHEWSATPGDRTTSGTGCPFCAGKKVSATNSLATLFPDIAAQWHPTKNGLLTPRDVVAGSGKNVWWQCSTNQEHEWRESVDERTRLGTGCPYCSHRRVSTTTSLAALHPGLAAEWHPTRNGGLTPDQVVAGAARKVWWLCPRGPDHEWQATVVNRTRLGSGCPCCAGQKLSVTNSLATLFPDVAAQWHPTKNGDRGPDQVIAGSNELFWWRCPEGPDHEWQAQPNNRTTGGTGCPFCAGKKLSVTNSLAACFPDIAAEWHPSRNGDVTPEQVVAGSERRVWWQCLKDPDHQWQATVVNRTRLGKGCPYCNRGWTVEAIRLFVSSLQDHLATFTPPELYLLFQQSGLLQGQGKGKAFVKALATGRFPRDEITKFVHDEPSLVDQFIQDPAQTLAASAPGTEQARSRSGPLPECGDPAEPGENGTEGDPLDRADALITDDADTGPPLPLIETKEVLASLGLRVISTADEEAIAFLLASAVAKIWTHAYRDEATAVAQAERFVGDGYAERVRLAFHDEYRQARELVMPEGYAFRVDGQPTLPNLMQRHVAVRVRDHKRVGNWSGTGAGKTLSAVLASRVAGADLTIVCCPNSVVEGWRRMILEIFPQSRVATKSFRPHWDARTGDDTGVGTLATSTRPRYLILNYEAFQQPDSAQRVGALVARERIDCVIVDEIHFTKQRTTENLSQRRQLVAALTAGAAARNPELRVLGMSATPVINNLQEGKSLIELVTGVAHDDLDVRPTVPNCMLLHQRLVTLGTRWLPVYDLKYDQVEVPTDCTAFVDQIRRLGPTGSPLALEQILTRARLPVIRQHIQPKTLLYTHYVEGIDRLLYDALVADGWRVGFYTGDTKTGLDDFLDGDLDVLIASSAIATGVDGLQQVCNRLIVNVLPWTAAEFEQLKGRLYRQGQRQDKVTLILPLTSAEINGQRWSWCASKMHRLAFKKSIADAAIDGVVPEGHLRTPAQAYEDLMAWLARLDAGVVAAIARPAIVAPLPAASPAEVDHRRHRYGDFSQLNRTWNGSRSEATHARLQAHPEEWAQYHTLYRAARQAWAVVPYEELIRWCRQRRGYVIGDFGCGEAQLAAAVGDRHVVHSFDHVAINEGVVACDMAHVPLDDGTLDVAVFSLSLMGSNVSDYLREAHRTLKLDGHLHVLEATARFSDRERFVAGLRELGFDVVAVEDKWKFTHIRALKTERAPRRDVEMAF